MSRGNMIVATILTFGLAAMFFWTLSLSRRTPDYPPSTFSGAEAPSDWERRLRAVEERTEVNAARVGQVESRTTQRMEELEGRLSEALSAGIAPEALAPSTPAPTSMAALEATIDKVIDEREAQQERARREQMARGMVTRWLLNEVPATDQQRDQLIGVITTYLSAREELRRNADEGGVPDAEAVRRLDGDLNASIGRIFSATEASTIQARLDTMARRFGGGGGGGRDGDAPRGRTGGAR